MYLDSSPTFSAYISEESDHIMFGVVRTLKNIRLEMEYDRTDLYGWQVQPKLRTVQGEIQDRLNTIRKHEINLIGAGRTEVGVYALCQVANFKTENPQDKESFLRGLNGLLPDDVVIKKAEEVDLDFNARYSAKSRLYKYRVYLGRTAILRRYVWEVLYSLNLEKILKATDEIRGDHDFFSFCVAESTKENNICKVTSVTWEKSGNELIFVIEADRFLHTMVRSLVGTLQTCRLSLSRHFCIYLHGLMASRQGQDTGQYPIQSGLRKTMDGYYHTTAWISIGQYTLSIIISQISVLNFCSKPDEAIYGQR